MPLSRTLGNPSYCSVMPASREDRAGPRKVLTARSHRGITLETRNAGVRSILEALIQLPELRRGQKGCAAAHRAGFVWEGGFFPSLVAEGQLPSSSAPAGAGSRAGPFPAAPGKTSPWIKRPCKPDLAAAGSSVPDKDGCLVGLPPLSPLVL